MSQWTYRVCEECIDSECLYYPERRKLLGWDRPYGIYFSTIEDARRYLSIKEREEKEPAIVKKYYDYT